MPIFAPYTGQRVSPIPSGYLAAEGQRAKMLQQGMASIGRAIEGWGKRKGEDTLRDERLQALMSSFAKPAEQGWMMESGPMDAALSQAIEKDALSKEDRRQNLAQERALDVYGLKQKFDEEDAALRESHKKLNEQANMLRARAAGAGAPLWLSKAWEATLLRQPLGAEFVAKEQAAHDNLRATEASVRQAREALEELQKNATPPGVILNVAEEVLGDWEEKFKAAKLKVDSIDNVLSKATEARELREEGERVEAQLGLLKKRHEDGQAKLLQEYLRREEAPVTTAQDAVYADMDRFKKQVEVAPASWDPRLLEVLGPKLLKKAESGNLTRGDTRVAIEKLENLMAEDRAVRSPEGRLRQLQMKLLEAQRARGQREDRQKAAWDKLVQRLGGMGKERRLASQTVTPTSLKQQVRSGKMTAAEAIQREEAIVEHMRGRGTPSGIPGLPRGDEFDFGDVRGLLPYASGAELKALEERKKLAPGQDALYTDAWKHNRAFQLKYGHVNPEQQEFKWHVEEEFRNYTLNPDARQLSLEEHMARFAPPQEMQQNFERALTGAESREQALKWVDQVAGKLGQAGLTAALAHVDRQFPPDITTKRIPDTNAVMIFQGGRLLGQATIPTPLSTIATPITDAQGRPTGKMLTPDGKMVDDPGMPKEGGEAWVEVKGLAGNYTGQARTKAEAVAFRARYTTALEVVPKIDALLLMTGIPAKELADLTGRDEAAIKAERDAFESKYGPGYDYEGGEVELYGPMRQDADALVIALTGMLRVAVTGPGAMTKEEAERIAKLIANPYELDKKDMSVRISLKSARAMMINSVDAFAQAQGIQRAPVGPAQPGGGATPGGVPKVTREDINRILKEQKNK